MSATVTTLADHSTAGRMRLMLAAPELRAALYDIWAVATDPGLTDSTARELIVAVSRAAIAALQGDAK